MLVDGAFASALDADSEGEEGRFYVWDAAEIDRLLGADAPTFRLAYGVTDAGNWEGHNVLNRLHEPGLPAPEEAERLARDAGERLLAARERRIRPGRDDKVLADWNGLMIAALAEAAGQLGQPDWLRAGRATPSRPSCAHMSDGDRLFHSWRAGRRLPMAFLDDYAQMSRAALALFQQTGEPGYLDRAPRLGRALPGRTSTTARTAASSSAPPRRTARSSGRRTPMTAPRPAANGTLAEVAATLWHLTGDERYRASRRRASWPPSPATPAPTRPATPRSLVATRLLTGATQIVVVGDEATPGFGELLGAAAAASAPPACILQRMAPGAELPATHPAAGKRLLDGRATAYVCRGTTCEAPLVEPGDLRERLSRPDAAA